jgi:hypothetical protein
MVRDEIKEVGSYDTDKSDDILRRFNQGSPNFENISQSKHKRRVVKDLATHCLEVN